MDQEVNQNPITPETCFVPKTHEGKGRRTAVAPGTTAARFALRRITLAAGDRVEVQQQRSRSRTDLSQRQSICARRGRDV